MAGPPAPGARQREAWLVDVNPVGGHEQAGRRPAVVISVDRFSSGGSKLAIVVPLTTTDRGNPLHVRIEPDEGGVTATSFAMCEMVRSISRERLVSRWGVVRPATLAAIVRRVNTLVRPS